MAAHPPFSVPVQEPQNENEGPIRRSVISPDRLLETPNNTNIRTLYDLMNYIADKYENRKLFGTREVVAIIEEEKEIERNGVKEVKKWQYYQLSPYTWRTYREVEQRTKRIGAALRTRLGMKAGDCLLIFNSTSADWMTVAHGCFSQSIIISTAYETLGEDGLLHALNETESVALFTNVDLLPVVERLGNRTTHLRYVIYNGKTDKAIPTLPGIEFIPLSELEEAGAKANVEPVPPKPRDTACIMYTSGSTGNPKGVLLLHSNMVAAIAGGSAQLEFHVMDGDRIIAYLPLAHVLEFIVEHVAMFFGLEIGYGSPRTLTDLNVRNCVGDLRELRPTIMAGVPAVWDTIRKAVLSKLQEASPAVRKIFNTAFKLKWKLMRAGLPTKFIDPVFSKIRSQTGGRLRFALSGGAAISEPSQKFLSVTVCPVVQGYGMTESCGICTLLSPEMFRLKSVGAPVPCTEVKLVDVPEMGYSSKDPIPRGEVWMRGPGVTSGYYKNPKVTDETYTSDGWLMTGDIGQWNPDGTLSIIDRKKNLVKLSHGEYIALEKLESIYKCSHLVTNICVYADSTRDRAVALIVAPEKEVERVGREINVHGTFNEIFENLEVRKHALKEIIAAVKAQGLRGAELIGDLYFCEEEWTPLNGMLTAAQKLRRNEIYKKYRKQIDDMYARMGGK
jgi:long-chain acyl-CoA synthetase